MARKFVRGLVGGVSALALVLGLAASAAYAGTGGVTPSTGNAVNIKLTSTVADACSIGTSATSYSLGDLQQTPASGTTVATITEACNDPSGYTVTLTSANATSGNQLFLKGTTNASNVIDYTLSYGGQTVSYTGGSATLTTATAPTAQAGVQNALAISTTAGFYAADTYADTLTLTLKAS